MQCAEKTGSNECTGLVEFATLENACLQRCIAVLHAHDEVERVALGIVGLHQRLTFIPLRA